MTNTTDEPQAAADGQGAPLNAESLFLGLASTLGATSLTMTYVAGALVAAAAERGAIDPARLFALLDVLAAAFESGQAAKVETGRLTAMMLRGVRPAYENMILIPPGAGRA